MSKKSKPQIGKREAIQLAKRAETEPLEVLQLIGNREQHPIITLNFYAPSRGWYCGLSFSGAMYAAKGYGERPGIAVKQAILRAYDTGPEKDWQLKERSFQVED
jgi:hypothetical protein